jgi:hypothetical protein
LQKLGRLEELITTPNNMNLEFTKKQLEELRPKLKRSVWLKALDFAIERLDYEYSPVSGKNSSASLSVLLKLLSHRKRAFQEPTRGAGAEDILVRTAVNPGSCRSGVSPLAPPVSRAGAVPNDADGCTDSRGSGISDLNRCVPSRGCSSSDFSHS